MKLAAICFAFVLVLGTMIAAARAQDHGRDLLQAVLRHIFTLGT